MDAHGVVKPCVAGVSNISGLVDGKIYQETIDFPIKYGAFQSIDDKLTYDIYDHN